MDPFEDFEFKPLTEGLGFHKKSDKKAKAPEKQTDRPARPIPEPAPRTTLPPSAPKMEPRTASQSISDLIASLPPSLDFLEDKDETPSKPIFDSPSSLDTSYTRPQIFQPIGREEYKAPTGPTIGSVLTPPASKPNVPPMPGMPAPRTATAATPAIPTTSNYRERLDESFARAFPHAERRTKAAAEPEVLQPISAHLGAGFLDGMVVSGLATVFLVCILAITRVNLVAMLSSAQTDGTTQLNLAMLFMTVLVMYMLTARAFFGASLGEWAFDLQMGSDEDRKKWTYPLFVVWRTILNTATRIILIPAISLALNKDVMKPLTGLQLYRRL